MNGRAENMPSEQDEQDEQQQAIHDAAIRPKKSAARPIRGEPQYKPNEHQDPIRNGYRHFLALHLMNHSGGPVGLGAIILAIGQVTPLPESSICNLTPAPPKTSVPDRTSPLRQRGEQE
jgi:hypothetical protein